VAGFLKRSGIVVAKAEEFTCPGKKWKEQKKRDENVQTLLKHRLEM
jgi:hypothetical protein